jgi:hypothetical protein
MVYIFAQGTIPNKVMAARVVTGIEVTLKLIKTGCTVQVTLTLKRVTIWIWTRMFCNFQPRMSQIICVTPTTIAPYPLFAFRKRYNRMPILINSNSIFTKLSCVSFRGLSNTTILQILAFVPAPNVSTSSRNQKLLDFFDALVTQEKFLRYQSRVSKTHRKIR